LTRHNRRSHPARKGRSHGHHQRLRGSPASDRIFSLIGTASAVLGNLAGVGSPNAIAGAVTGIGFIGGGSWYVVRSAPALEGPTSCYAG
jgi:hypothetical protein